ncbi:MAG: DUF3352 domain-containing protein [Solirubrobacterales bacterium]
MSIHGHRPRRIATALPLVAVLAAIAGCGSSHTSGTSADPAGAVPSPAPLYAGATVRPEGSLKTNAAAAGRTFTRQADPYLRLLTAMQTPGSAPLDFGRDVAPWLGPRAGVFLSSLGASGGSGASALLSLLARGLLAGSPTASAFPFSAHGARGAIVLDTSDAAKARAFLDSQARHAGAHAAAYRGVAYQVTLEGVAFGLVDRFAVIGSEDGLRSVIDTTLGGASLAHATGYAKLLALAPAGALAHVYVNPRAAGPSLASGSGGSGSTGRSGSSEGPTSGSSSQGLAGLLGLLAGTREANISLVPTKSSIELDADGLTPVAGAQGPTGQAGGLLAGGSEAARAAGELPGDSWLAVGLGDVGTTLGGDVLGLRALTSLSSSLGRSGTETASAGLTVKGLLEGILTPLGLLGADTPQARRDFQSWMGSAGIFASGTGLLDLKAGIVISSTDPARSRAAVSKLAALLGRAGGSVQAVSIPGAEAAIGVSFTGLPVTLDIVAGRNAHGQARFVIGLTEASVAAALNPSSTLADAASYSAAKTTLGEGFEPSIIVDFPTFLGLLEGVGLSEDPTISRFVPYLRTLATLAGGTKSLGEGVERLRLVLGLQQQAG